MTYFTITGMTEMEYENLERLIIEQGILACMLHEKKTIKVCRDDEETDG